MSIDELFAPLEADEATAARLRDRLGTAADAAGLLDVAFDVVDSPVGPLLLAATERGLVKVAFEREDHDRVLQALADEVGPRVLAVPARVADVARQLAEYFAGQRTRFDVAVDLRLAHGFRRDVVAWLPHISYGTTASYGQVARAVGNPRAVRAVGSACARNPVPLVVPCHRVVRSDGSLGRYGGGEDAKRLLLELEAAA